MYCVYWIRLQDFTDIATQGYVGITKNLKERVKAHKKNKRKTIFTLAKAKYGFDTFIIDVIAKDISLKEALEIEKSLRPDPRIGWNCQKGGELGVDSSWYSIEENKNKHRKATSIATKEGIALKDTPEKRSERAKNSWKTGNYGNVSVGENNPKALLKEAQVKVIKYELLEKFSNREIAEMYGVKPYIIQFIRSNKNWKHV